MNSFKEFLPILATLFTAIFGAGGVLLRDWLQKRDNQHQRKEARLEAAELISVIEKWIATQQLICSPEEFEQVKLSARKKLDRVYSALVNSQNTRKSERHSFIRRAFLFYRPVSVRGWILHAIFYVLATLILLWAITSIFTILDPRVAEIDLELFPLRAIIFVIILYFLLLLVPALAIRAWALVIDKKDRLQIERKALSPLNWQGDDDLPFILLSSDEVDCLHPKPSYGDSQR